MKYVKMLGLAAVAAAALMAFVGAGAASAAPVVCSTTVSPCPAAQIWPNQTVDFSTTAAGGKAVLSDTFNIVKNECESTVQGSLANPGASGTPTLSGITLTWTGCSEPTKTITAGKLEIDTITGSSNGTVTVESEFEVTSVVTVFGSSEDCIFRAAPGLDLGTLTEGKPPTLAINVVVNGTPTNPANCPATAKWKANYTLTSPAGTTGSLSHN